MPNKMKSKCLVYTIRQYLILFLFIGLSASGCAKKEIIVPSLTPEPSQQQFTGKFVWYDLFTYDMHATSKFYQELFGWTFEDTLAGDIRIKTINRDNVSIANVIEINPNKKNRRESIWLGYISIPDVDNAVELVKQLGGTIYKKPKDLANRGRIAIVTDSQGAIFGLVHSPDGDPPDPEDIQNSFIGSELWAIDINQAMTFYTSLAGYEINIVDVGPDQKYHLLERDNIPRAGVAKIQWDDVKPNWIPYVAIEDVRETIKKVEALGGKVLIKPPEETLKNPVAIVADPSGAVFGLQQIRDLEISGGN
jgi:predicted enzyme related to lactoylglutathione lyase